jgi:hypothetical protein
MRQKKALHLPADGIIPKQKTENNAQKSNAEFKPSNGRIVSQFSPWVSELNAQCDTKETQI